MSTDFVCPGVATTENQGIIIEWQPLTWQPLSKVILIRLFRISSGCCHNLVTGRDEEALLMQPLGTALLMQPLGASLLMQLNVLHNVLRGDSQVCGEKHTRRGPHAFERNVNILKMKL